MLLQESARQRNFSSGGLEDLGPEASLIDPGPIDLVSKTPVSIGVLRRP